jgi:putative transposase
MKTTAYDIRMVLGVGMVHYISTPEYISHALKGWVEKHYVTLQYILPGNPQINAYVERYDRTVRCDWLNQNIFDSISSVQDYAGTHSLWTYNNEKPNLAFGVITPKQKL